MNVHHPVALEVVALETPIARFPPHRLLKSRVHHAAETGLRGHRRPDQRDHALLLVGRVHHVVERGVSKNCSADQLLLEPIHHGLQHLVGDRGRGRENHLLVDPLHVGAEVVYASLEELMSTVQQVARDGRRLQRGVFGARRDARVVARPIHRVAEGVIVDEGPVDARYVLRSAVIVWVHVRVGHRLELVQTKHHVVVLDRLVDGLVQ